jgi:hypothetical protein
MELAIGSDQAKQAFSYIAKTGEVVSWKKNS